MMDILWVGGGNHELKSLVAYWTSPLPDRLFHLLQHPGPARTSGLTWSVNYEVMVSVCGNLFPQNPGAASRRKRVHRALVAVVQMQQSLWRTKN